MRIRDGKHSDPRWKKVRFGTRDKHPGSATLPIANLRLDAGVHKHILGELADSLHEAVAPSVVVHLVVQIPECHAHYRLCGVGHLHVALVTATIYVTRPRE
jgi:hypothetical protein